MENKVIQLKNPEVLSLHVGQAALLVTRLGLSGQAKVMNPNSVSIDIDGPTVTTRGASGTMYNEDILPGVKIAANAIQPFDFNIVVPTEAFKEQNLNINFNFIAPAAERMPLCR